MRSLLWMGVLAIGLAAANHPAEAAGVRMFVRHEVSDYAAWRKGYDSFDATRRKMGVSAQAVYRSSENPLDITVTHDFATLAKAKAFGASAELKAAMEKAGVSNTPQVWFTNKTATRPEATGARLFVRHEVTDYAAWRKVYDAFDVTRRKLGVVAQAVYRSADNPNDVTVTHDFKTVEAAKAFSESQELKDAMAKAGVSNTPQVWITTRARK